MYRQLARWFQERARLEGQTSAEQQQAAAMKVFEAHPQRLLRFLEEAWFMRADVNAPALALPADLLPDFGSGLGEQLDGVQDDIYPLFFDTGAGGARVPHHHLMYAYGIENTCVLPIMERVIRAYRFGETLEVPSAATQRWLRATEQLFFRPLPTGHIGALTSWLEERMDAVRRIDYWSTFGMDLNHGGADGRPYPYEKPQAANRDFVGVLEEFLRQVWSGAMNAANTSGPNVSDDAAIANLAQQLYDMLRVRRLNGNRTERDFIHVTWLSWFHLTVEFDSPLVRDLKAEGPSPEERLRKIGERVGVPAHAKSESYFIIAEALSRLLILIERGTFNSPDNARALYAPSTGPVPNGVREDAMAVITHWSLASGRDLKAHKTSVLPPALAMTNGHGPPPRVALPSG